MWRNCHGKSKYREMAPVYVKDSPRAGAASSGHGRDLPACTASWPAILGVSISHK